MSHLRIYNTLTREKQEFVPLVEGRVNLYVCGPTVYDLPHLGHAKSYVSFDVVVRYLRHLGFDVLYVQNITDVGHLVNDADEGESKIEKAARERKVEPMALVERCTRAYFSAMEALGCLPPDISPRATGHIPEMIELIQRLIAAGHAYDALGNVYFDVESFRDYGKLSRRRVDDQEAGSRVEPGAGKRHPSDFALWKSAEGTGHVMRWNSPWGVGFPGWHIECSAMSMKYLGETLDIHGAGVENVFPHNEDEIAQSECATHAPFARYWMHNGTVNINGEKMSKSKGNFRTIVGEIERHGADLVRYWVLSSHYRSPVDYSDEGMQEAGKALERLRTAARAAERFAGLPEADRPGADADASRLDEAAADAERHFHAAMLDDFNTPAALAALFGLSTEMNRVTGSAAHRQAVTTAAVDKAQKTLGSLAAIVGLQLQQSRDGGVKELTGPLVETILFARASLRKNKDYQTADELRKRLGEMGIVVEDRPNGATWRME